MNPDLTVNLSEIAHIRGIRNNNPLNLKRSLIWWDGQEGSDGTFCIFKNMAYGFRAAFRTLDTYYHVHKLQTLRGIINRWAPPTENETSAYLRAVSIWAEQRQDAILPNPRTATRTWLHIVRAMTAVECTPDSVRCLAVLADMAAGWELYQQSINLRSHE